MENQKTEELFGMLRELTECVKGLSERVSAMETVLEKISGDDRRDSALTYDLMLKMLNSQQSLIENTVNLLEAHSIIDQAETALEIFGDIPERIDNAVYKAQDDYFGSLAEALSEVI